MTSAAPEFTVWYCLPCSGEEWWWGRASVLFSSLWNTVDRRPFLVQRGDGTWKFDLMAPGGEEPGAVSHLRSALSQTFRLPGPQPCCSQWEEGLTLFCRFPTSSLSPVREPLKSSFFRNITNGNQIGSRGWWNIIQRACSQISVSWKQNQVLEREVEFLLTYIWVRPCVRLSKWLDPSKCSCSQVDGAYL